jgi:hypothetical protein
VFVRTGVDSGRSARGPRRVRPAKGEANDLLIDQIAFLFRSSLREPRGTSVEARWHRARRRARPHSPHSHRIQERSFGRLGWLSRTDSAPELRAQGARIKDKCFN